MIESLNQPYFQQKPIQKPTIDLRVPYYHVITPNDDRLLDASNRLDPMNVR